MKANNFTRHFFFLSAFILRKTEWQLEPFSLHRSHGVEGMLARADDPGGIFHYLEGLRVQLQRAPELLSHGSQRSAGLIGSGSAKV